MAIQSSEGKYWAERFAKIEVLEKRTADRVIKELNAEYSKTLEALEKDITYWYNRLALNNNITGPDALKEAKKLLTAAELKEFKWTVEEYIKHASDSETAVKFAREIENASARAHINRLEAIKLQTAMHVDYLTAVQTSMVIKMIGDVFTDSFYRAAYEMQRAAGMFQPFQTIDVYAVKQAIEKPWSADGVGYSTRIWRNQEALKIRLDNELTQNIIRGQSPKKLITGFTEEFGVSRHQAARLIQTERAAAASRANYDSYRATETEYYVIVATLDLKTSEICQDIDGRVFRIEDYVIGSTAPPFHPFCRSTTAPYYEGEELTGSRIYRDAEGNSQYTDEYVTYKEWKEKYVDNAVVYELDSVQTSNGITVSGVSKHALDQAFNRKVSANEMKEALTNPLKVGIIKYKNNMPGQEFIGKRARVIINPDTGNVITTWKTSTKLRGKLENNKL